MQVDRLANVVESLVNGIATRKASRQVGDGNSIVVAVVGV
jgi:hypothetical protein